MRLLLSTYEPNGPRDDVDPIAGPAAPLRALGARGAETPVCAPPVRAEPRAGVGAPLAPGGMMPAMLDGGWR